MSAEPGSGPAPAAKAPPPPLMARMRAPGGVHLRRPVVGAAIIGAALLVAGALAWAFVVQPELRAATRARAAEAQAPDAHGPARPSEAITAQPASYDRLPPPRRLVAAAGGTEYAAGPKARTAEATRPRGPARRTRREPVPDTLRLEAQRSGLFFTTGEGQAPPIAEPAVLERPPPTPAAPAAADSYNPHRLTLPLSPYELKAGTVIPAALLTAIDTSRPGPVVAAVSEDVFDTVAGRHRLLPQGTRIIGRHEGAGRHGDRRAYLAWERLILPDGRSLALTGAPGVDPQGALGLEGRVDRRLGPLAVASLFAGAITTLGQAARDQDEGGGLLGDAGDAAAIQAAQVGGRLIDRELDVAPRIRLEPGASVQVLVTRDLVLEPYP